MGKFTRRDAIEAIRLKLPAVTRKDVDLVVEALFNELSMLFVSGRDAEFRGFGSFKCRDRKARTAQNPKTMEKVDVPARRTVAFFPGNELREKLRAVKAA